MQLEVRDIKKSFGDKEVLHGVSFTVQSGRAMGFLGRNGAGKSTTIRCLMDVFHQDEGGFYLDGQPLNITKYRVGYLPEERGMYQKHTVLEQLAYFGQLRGATRAQALASANYWVDYFGLSEYKKKKLETLSKGNQQKIQIAQSFLNEPDILILDEPFSGLDPVNAQVFKDTIARFVSEGKLVIFSSHQMGYVEEICDDITLIHQGHILLTGDLEQIKRELGENKLQLRIEGMADEALAATLTRAFPVLLTQPHEDGLILDTQNQVTQRQILDYISQQGWIIHYYGLYTPSLNDIFIAKAGEQA
ncbi:MAG: ATP-binding cassette domain-containing protein [Clostridiales bacterium]|nr:ATP-binding cassette domain-containing protein [Clostridiales bacterium]